MKRAATALMILVLASASFACYRTRYVNLRELEAIPPANPARPEPVSRWQHFFVYGWFPNERVIDAGRACGGPEKVEAIETRQTFLQGLIAVFASVYINVYSPYSGEVICRGAVRR